MKKLNVTINFDLDGTLADLYGVENWLEMLINEDPTPYAIAKPLLRFNTLARKLNRLQQEGYELAVITWLSKCGSPQYNLEVSAVKMEWLKKHLPSVKWDRVTILPHGTPKNEYCGNAYDILFDDEMQNREEWGGIAYDVTDIMGVLKTL